jgi:hypothetical protein
MPGRPGRDGGPGYDRGCSSAGAGLFLLGGLRGGHGGAQRLVSPPAPPRIRLGSQAG